MKKDLLVLIISLLVCLSFGYGQQRGANMPYVRYESEDGNYGGSATLYEAPEFRQEKTAAEASDQKYVGLPSNGSYVEWTVNETADGITMRYTMPDASDGSGLDGSLNVYVNGNKVKTVDLTSYWAWAYFPGTEPENTPGENPRMRFDETHFMLDNPVNAGDVIRIEKTNGDDIEYGIDFIEIEDVPQKRSKPSGAYSVTDYGAVPDDGNDDLAAFNQCIDEANAAGADVYIPEGRFILSDQLVLDESNIKITGAGMWYTTIYFSTDEVESGGIVGEDACSNLEFSHMYINTALNSRYIDGAYAVYKAFMDTYGQNSHIHHVWIEHFECGAWIADYDDPIVVTDGLTISDSRIRNNYADGVNFCQGTKNSVVENTNLRNNGDDALAIWPNNDMGAPMAVNNTFRYNTIEHNYRAAGIAIFGGDGHEAHHTVIKDNFAGSGIRLNTTFPGYHFSNTNEIKFYEITIENCGTSNDLWNGERGSIDMAANSDPLRNLTYENIDIIGAQRNAIQMGYGSGFENINFSNISINGTGLDPYTNSKFTQDHQGKAIMTYTSNGEAYFNNLSMENIEADDPLLVMDGFNLTIENQDVPLEGISLSPTSIELADGEEAQLDLSFSPSNATNKNVTWESSDPSVVSILSTDTYSATIAAESTGSATITVKSKEGGYTAQCNVTVTAAVNITAPNAEASEDGDIGTFDIDAAGISESVTVGYTVSGTADESDYNASPELSGSIDLTSTNPSKTIEITPIDDDEYEGDENIEISLETGSGYQLGGNTSASVKILDNNLPPVEAPVVLKTSSPVSIDQSIESSWNNAPAMSIGNVSIGSMPSDFEGQWRALFDSNNLYVLVEVSDNSLNNDSGTEWWNDDAIELYIDGDNSKNSSYDGENDFQLGFRWNDDGVNVGGNSVDNTSGIEFSQYQTSSGYNLEVSIPWSTIGVSPGAGDVIGFDVAVDDDDGGGSRDAQIVSISSSDQLWSDPSLFGSVNLTTKDGSTDGNKAPVADAGSDQAVKDEDEDGTETVSLDGSGSSDPDGSINSYTWSEDGSEIATGATPEVNLGLGSHTITLTVEDDSGATANDQVNITIEESTGDTTTIEAPVVLETSSSVSIDQNIDSSWNNAPAMSIGNVSIGSMPSDFEGQWRALFDSNNLYVLVEVSDNSLNNDSGTEWWNDDAIELYIDGDNSKNSSYDGENDFQLGFRWNDDGVNVGGNSVDNTSGIEFSQYQTSSGYNLEVSIPWSTIGVSPGAGDVIGFDVAVDDDDGGGSRDAQIVSISSSDQLWSDPSLFGSVDLVAETESGQTPYTTHELPGVVQAEDYDNGGQDVAYYDVDSGNNGGAYREEDVDIESTTNNGYNIGWISDGEWTEYTISTVSSGTYDINIDVASNNDATSKSITIKLNGTTIGTVNPSYTGGWQSWETLTLSGVEVSGGSDQVLRLEYGGGEFNLDKIEFVGVNLEKSADPTEEIPDEYGLGNNYPNPFNPETRIEYSLPEESQVELKIYDIQGRHVRTLVNEHQDASKYTVNFNAKDLSSGIYFYRIRAGSFTKVKRMLLIK